MKIAISIPEEIFEEVEEVTRQEKVSRSRVISDALREYLQNRQHRQILNRLNEVYAEPESGEDKRLRDRAKRYYRRKARQEKW